MTRTFQTISPVDGSVVAERAFADSSQIERALSRSTEAFQDWKRTPLEQRQALVQRFFELAVRDVDAIAQELTMQIGRPIRDGAGEARGWLERGHKMLELSRDALADTAPSPREGFTRFIRREPLGTVLTLAPWNYPWLTTVNSLVPALLAGNTVLLKHSEQTPLVAERMLAAAVEAGVPDAVFQVLHLSHEQVAQIIGDRRVAFVAFTGSVEGGHAVQAALAERFAGASLELGGKDGAYVCSDADVDACAAALSEGAFYNAGQSCCGIERIYVQREVFAPFIDAFAAATQQLVLGDPREPQTTLGPVVRKRNAQAILAQLEQAVAAGARPIIDPKHFPEAGRGAPYLQPQALVDVDHDMTVMREETFGPVVGIMPVSGDEEADRLMNDSRYGLTASVWTADLERALRLGEQVDVGTWFMNRCDYLDPELAWVGVKDSGRGCSLSALGFAQLSRPKSFHLRQTLG
mgnify:CR=1 FL=1